MPRLKDIEKKFDIVPEKAATIAKIAITTGTLSAWRIGKLSIAIPARRPLQRGSGDHDDAR